MQDHRQINVKQPDTNQPPDLASPANSPWLTSAVMQGISMQREVGQDLNGNQLQEKNKNSDSDEKTDVAESLASGFSTSFTVFMSVIVISTMSLFIYSNSQDGAFVEVQGFSISVSFFFILIYHHLFNSIQ